MRVVFEESYPLSANDFSPFIRKVQQSGADILFMCSTYQTRWDLFVPLTRKIYKSNWQAEP